MNFGLKNFSLNIPYERDLSPLYSYPFLLLLSAEEKRNPEGLAEHHKQDPFKWPYFAFLVSKTYNVMRFALKRVLEAFCRLVLFSS